MLSAAKAAEPLTAAHRAKLAYIYVRQSSLQQVRQHQESTELQYRLVERAVGLGWPRERVHVIDEDLGRSGAASSERHGFQRLIAEMLRLSRERGSSGERVISPPPPQHILAARIGARRETVSRELARMSREGLLTVGRRAIVLHRPQALGAE